MLTQEVHLTNQVGPTFFYFMMRTNISSYIQKPNSTIIGSRLFNLKLNCSKHFAEKWYFRTYEEKFKLRAHTHFVKKIYHFLTAFYKCSIVGIKSKIHFLYGWTFIFLINNNFYNQAMRNSILLLETMYCIVGIDYFIILFFVVLYIFLINLYDVWMCKVLKATYIINKRRLDIVNMYPLLM